jgi:hypothetical protein
VQAENEIAGAVRGIPFTEVAAALVIESPESEDTTVIDLSSDPLPCVDLSFSGWDRCVAAGTSILQLKVRGKLPGRYLAVLPLTLLSSREGTATWMRNERAPASREMDAQGGWITIETLSADGSATGTFDLDFASGRLMGRFHATFCGNGHEP